MTTDNFCFYLQNRLIQTSQTGGQRYSDTSPFSIPWSQLLNFATILSGPSEAIFLASLHLSAGQKIAAKSSEK